MRERTGRFLVEGPQGVREAVRYASGDVVDVYVTPDAAARYPQIVDDARARGLYLHVASDDVLAAMSADAQGILAVVRARALTLDAALRGEGRVRPGGGPVRLVAVLTEVRDPGNAGTVVRAADAAGADLVVLTRGSVDLHNPKVVRSTAGSLFHLPVVTGVGLDEALEALRAHGLAVLATDGTGELDLDDLARSAGRTTAPGSRAPAGDAPGSRAPTGDAPATAPAAGPDLAAPTAWVFGTEATGLDADQRALADAVVRVPIRGLAESLNLATAATVCLYASSRALFA